MLHDLQVLKRVVHFIYEDLCGRTGEVLKAFMPELDGLDPSRSFQVYSTLGTKNNPITNINIASIARPASDDVEEISRVLCHYRDLLEPFSYKPC